MVSELSFGFALPCGWIFSLESQPNYCLRSLERTANLILSNTTAEKERLPTEVGWTRPAEPLGGADLLTTMDEIRNATAAATGATPQQAKRMFSDDIHGSAAREGM